MLKRRPSLAARAALIFISIYVATFLAGAVLLAAASLSSSGERHHAGPSLALSLAAESMVEEDGALTFPDGSALAGLADRNPSLWLLAELDGRRLRFGPVPEGADASFETYAGAVEAAKFHVPGVERPLADAAIEWRYTVLGPALLAAGGVDPDTIPLTLSLRHFVGEVLPVVLLVVGLLGLIAMLIALPLLTAALKPVAADAAAIRADRPDRRIDEARVPRELLPLVQGFNAALDRLSGEIERRRRFIADVAHELRTPLAIVSLQVDALGDEAAKEELQRVVARLSHLVGQMLDVERLSLAGQARAEVDLRALAADTVAEMAPMAIAAGYDLSLDAPEEPVTVQGDAQALGRALANLIGNAVAHGGGAGQIEVVVAAEGTIDVRDEGPGIAEAFRPALFEPFSRERWDRDGCGLGLHLTREIMRAHGGEALLLPSAHGAAFRLRFG